MLKSNSYKIISFRLGTQAGCDLGPVISPESKSRIETLIQSGVDEGANLLLDGRGVKVSGYEAGNFVGPTILTGVTVRFFYSYTTV